MDPQPRWTGKVVLVTGATDGIGKVAAAELARRGAVVVGVGRDAEKSERVAAEIRRTTGSDQVTFLLADLSSQAQVRELAEAFRQRYDRLDVLINNAGAYFTSRQESEDGLEMTFALNHLGYFLLTHLLLDLLVASAPARIINVSSDAHRQAEIKFDDLQGQARYSGWAAYGQSKLANVLFTYELARRLEGSGVTVNALHPGVVATNFAANNGPLSQVFRKVFNLVSLSPEKGADTMIYLASDPEVAQTSGHYFVKRQPVRASERSYDREAARRLWDASLQLTGLGETIPVVSQQHIPQPA